MSTDSAEPGATITASSPLVARKTSIWSESEDGTGSVVLSTSHMRRRYYLALFERSLAVSCAIALLVVSMWSYAGIKSLGKWQKRTFNLLSILSTGIMTLGLGSLLGYLGAMIRWPLLACRRGHSVEDVSINGYFTPPRSIFLT